MRFLIEKPGSSPPQKPFSIQEVRQLVRNAIHEAETRLTQLDIERRLSRYFQIDRRRVRSAIKDLVDQQELMYVSDFGHTFIETSLHKPIRITGKIVLKPWNCTFEPGAGDIVVSLCHGISFGSGQHPTTRLCLKGLEYLQQNYKGLWRGEKTRALDIGTGSGVLIITALKMGVASGVAVDIDACAISEARSNALNNGLSERITISSEPLESFQEVFNLILANLRSPTLKSLFPQMKDRTMPGGKILLSGIKTEELDSFSNQIHGLGLSREWVGEERGWAAIVLNKGS